MSEFFTTENQAFPDYLAGFWLYLSPMSSKQFVTCVFATFIT
ncbi:MAG: hypothetical protein RMY16_08945 [Nostoc sp. DedQUE12b]|nr:hypothetical protein [Nostoc sp. DedQUE12b]MDZ8085705.1 hypothetical protein [Nostoc sp. DedQUE12b]